MVSQEVVRCQFDYMVKISYSKPVLFEDVKRPCPVEECWGISSILGVQGESMVVVLNSLLVLVDIVISNSSVDISQAVSGVQSEGPAIILNSSLVFFQLIVNEATVVVSLEKSRIKS